MSILFRPTEQRALSFPTAAQMVAKLLGERTGESHGYEAEEALEVAAVTACVGLRSGAFAQLPLKAFRDRPDGSSEPLALQPDLLARPSDLVVPSVWKIQMSISRDLWGFALGRVTAWDAAMYPKRCEWIDPSSVHPVFDGRRLDWRIGNEVFDGSLFVHVPSRWVLPGNPVGISPLEHVGLVELADKARDFGRDWFRNGAVPSSIVYSDKPLDADSADRIVETILSKWRKRRPAVLGSGLRYEQVSVNAEESQFLETVRQVSAQIATCFNLPPEKIGAAISGGSITYANREQNQQQFLVDSVNPDLVVIQESLDRYSPRGQFCRFNTGAFLRSDLLTRYQSYEIGIRAGFLDTDEARTIEELPRRSAPVPPPGGGA